ncbi:MAG: PrsW family intramembrane metalloprotease [Chloroflexi bacterium]|nr:PrsW family intramembrane metalloprotease [Chloroflexota bacterium]
MRGRLFALALALSGGVFGIAGAVMQEVRGLPDPFVAGPLIEEAVKPAGLYLLLYRWPHLLGGRRYTAGLAALGGLAFGLVEAAVYVTVYVPEPSLGFVVYRFTLPLALHSLASFIYGQGIDGRLAAWVRGEGSLKATGWRFFVAAVVLHGLYNVGAVIAGVAGLQPK